MDPRKLNHIIQVAVMAAIMLALSLIPGIPLGPTPIVLENLGVMLAGILLGTKRGTCAVVLFILLKVVGLSGTGGLALLTSPTCGYVYGWLFVPLFTNLLLMMIKKHLNLLVIFLIVAVVNVVIVDFVGGSLGLFATVHFPITKALMYNCLFVPGDVVKAFVAALVGWQAMKSVKLRELLK